MKPHTTQLTMIALSALALVACAEELTTEADTNTLPTESGRFVHQEAAGVVTTVVDATSEEAWVALDLETRLEVEERAGTWELSFQRFQIRTNGGISGEGGVRVAPVVGVAFDALTQAPAEGWVEDAEDGDDGDDDLDLAFLAPEIWYDYNPANHTLSPREVVYVVETVEGAFFKIEITDYYDDAGTPAVLSFRWASVEPPAE